MLQTASQDTNKGLPEVKETQKTTKNIQLRKYIYNPT